MRYQKANEILPVELVELIQDYIDGEYVYIPRKQGEKCAGLPCQDRIDFPCLPAKGIVLWVEQQGNLIALGITVYNTEPAVHQMPDRINHGIPETDVKRRLKSAGLLGQLCKIPPVYPHRHVKFRKDGLVQGCLKPAHTCI